MEGLVAASVGVLVAVGVFLLLRPRTFTVVLGFAVLSYAINLFLFASGRLGDRAVPILASGGPPRDVAHFMDPLPQALVLTAIVIGLGMIAILLALALRAFSETGSDHVDLEEPEP